jgi:hypothetical protein
MWFPVDLYEAKLQEKVGATIHRVHCIIFGSFKALRAARLAPIPTGVLMLHLLPASYTFISIPQEHANKCKRTSIDDSTTFIHLSAIKLYLLSSSTIAPHPHHRDSTLPVENLPQSHA